MNLLSKECWGGGGVGGGGEGGREGGGGGWFPVLLPHQTMSVCTVCENQFGELKGPPIHDGL